ncbi:protein-tyrosine phosphatase-like protein [Zopfochytrium polystomum]|nr:protein-tyrosine phosphatase-like protein [Zopfochytrium polystomum]
MDACEWKYQMRHEIQEVIPHLWVGPYSCARDLEYCKRFGITHMLCVMDSAEKYRLARKHPDHFIYHDIDVTDSPLQNLIPFFPAAKAFIKSALDQGGTVLVYCNNGISRSPSFVIAYVMEANGWDFATAFNFVQNKRFCMNPLEGFKIQLKVSRRLLLVVSVNA